MTRSSGKVIEGRTRPGAPSIVVFARAGAACRGHPAKTHKNCVSHGSSTVCLSCIIPRRSDSAPRFWFLPISLTLYINTGSTCNLLHYTIKQDSCGRKRNEISSNKQILGYTRQRIPSSYPVATLSSSGGFLNDKPRKFIGAAEMVGEGLPRVRDRATM